MLYKKNHNHMRFACLRLLCSWYERTMREYVRGKSNFFRVLLTAGFITDNNVYIQCAHMENIYIWIFSLYLSVVSVLKPFVLHIIINRYASAFYVRAIETKWFETMWIVWLGFVSILRSLYILANRSSSIFIDKTYLLNFFYYFVFNPLQKKFYLSQRSIARSS